MHNLYILRHTESVWGKEDRFTGWEDIPLSDTGIENAIKLGEKSREAGFFPNYVVTSLLKRTIQTAFYFLEGNDRNWVTSTRAWYLNERHYGSLQGKVRSEMKKLYGTNQLQQWRRTYTGKPPEIEKQVEYSYLSACKTIPKSEALIDVYRRLVNNYYKELLPIILSNKNTLVVAHGNVMRAFLKFLKNLDDQEIITVEIPHNCIFSFQIDDLGEVVNSNKQQLI